MHACVRATVPTRECYSTRLASVRVCACARVTNWEIEKLLPQLYSRLYGADRAAEWSQRDANFTVTSGRPDIVVVSIARFLHEAREAIQSSGAFSGTRRFISNTVCGGGVHWIAVVVSVETVNNPP